MRRLVHYGPVPGQHGSGLHHVIGIPHAHRRQRTIDEGLRLRLVGFGA